MGIFGVKMAEFKRLYGTPDAGSLNAGAREFGLSPVGKLGEVHWRLVGKSGIRRKRG
jgi:hypothetical protein